MKTKIIILLLLFSMLFSFPVSAHSGRTDSNGGHYDHQNGGYHYHHGYSAHSHYDIDGDGIKDCPFTFKASSKNSSWSLDTAKIALIVAIGVVCCPYCYAIVYDLLDIDDSKAKKIALSVTVALLILFATILGFLHF